MRTLLALLLLCLPVCAQTVFTLTWDEDSDPDFASCIVQAPGFIDFTTSNEIDIEVEAGNYFFEVVAVDKRGVESFPEKLLVKCVAILRERSKDQVTWIEYAIELVVSGEPNEFFRIRLRD